jgi:hypothetical protein
MRLVGRQRLLVVVVALCRAGLAAMVTQEQLFSEEIGATNPGEGRRLAIAEEADTSQELCNKYYKALFPGKTTVDRG